jgi:hypothetical protein
METMCWEIERRSDGAILVRVRSNPAAEPHLPDAVFAFRDGDPQYKYWEARYRERHAARRTTAFNGR